MRISKYGTECMRKVLAKSGRLICVIGFSGKGGIKMSKVQVFNMHVNTMCTVYRMLLLRRQVVHVLINSPHFTHHVNNERRKK